MKPKTLLFLILLSMLCSVEAKTWLVGASRTYTKPSQVAGLVANGDTVRIDAGIYNSDVCAWNKNNLVLKGAGGFAHLKANGTTYGGKAIWVIQGNNVEVDSIEFSLASCVDLNGAGIRIEGKGLNIRRCYFHDNENGILGGTDTTCDLLVENSEFYNNGYGDGYSHNLYIGHIRSLTFRFNYSHHAKVGHELKSRASKNYILYNRFDDETDGTASRSIDLPNGGLAIIIGNELVKGPASQNSNFLEFGVEGLTNPGPQQCYIVHNTFVNNHSTGIFINLASGVATAKINNNIFAGTGTQALNSPTSTDSSNNMYGSIVAQNFQNTGTGDYGLKSNSPAIAKGKILGTAASFSLTADREYVFPVSYKTRTIATNPDAGAHAWANPANVKNKQAIEFKIFPNPVSQILYVKNGEEKCEFTLYSLNGNLIRKIQLAESKLLQEIELTDLPNGNYLVVFTRKSDGSQFRQYILKK